MKTLALIAIRNVLLYWRQSLASIISVSAGFMSLVIFQGYMEDMKHLNVESFRSRMMYGDGIIEHPKFSEQEGMAEPWKHSISEDESQAIQKYFVEHSSEISAWIPFVLVEGVITNGPTSTIYRGYGYDFEKGVQMRGKDWAWNALYGVPADVAKNPVGVILGQSLGKILSCRPLKKEKILDASAGYKAEVRPFNCLNPQVQVNTVTGSGQLNASNLEVVGMIDAAFKEIDNKFVAMSLEQAHLLMDTKNISYFTVKLNSEDQVPEFIQNFNAYAEKNQIVARMKHWTDHLVGDIYNKTMSLLTIFRNFVVVIIVSIAGLSIFNTMLKIVKERTREIGTLRSLGFIPSQILFIFTFEGFLLSFIGCAIGAVLGLFSTFLLNSLQIVYKAGMLVEPILFHIQINLDLYLISYVLLSLIAVLTAYLATRSTIQRNVAENLIYA